MFFFFFDNRTMDVGCRAEDNGAWWWAGLTSQPHSSWAFVTMPNSATSSFYFLFFFREKIIIISHHNHMQVNYISRSEATCSRVTDHEVRRLTCVAAVDACYCPCSSTCAMCRCASMCCDTMTCFVYGFRGFPRYLCVSSNSRGRKEKQKS